MVAVSVLEGGKVPGAQPFELGSELRPRLRAELDPRLRAELEEQQEAVELSPCLRAELELQQAEAELTPCLCAPLLHAVVVRPHVVHVTAPQSAHT
jgi:hypothetical protein